MSARTFVLKLHRANSSAYKSIFCCQYDVLYHFYMSLSILHTLYVKVSEVTVWLRLQPLLQLLVCLFQLGEKGLDTT